MPHFCHNHKFSQNQKILLESIKTAKVEIFHLERLVHILNRPENYSYRLEFLDIEMTKEELVAYFATIAKQPFEELQKLQKGFDEVLSKLQRLKPEKESDHD